MNYTELLEKARREYNEIGQRGQALEGQLKQIEKELYQKQGEMNFIAKMIKEEDTTT